MEKCEKKIDPIFNRCIIFHTCKDSFHGHPEPLKCPETVKRRSIALYYFRNEKQIVSLSPTNYRARPNDKFLNRILISFDRKLLWIHSFSKRYLGLKDEWVQKIMNKFK